MGQSNSRPTRLTKEKRKQRDQLKTDTLAKRKRTIDKLQDDMINNHESAVTQKQSVITMLQIGEIAKHQLDRGGDVLTKSDLVAVVAALDPSLRSDVVRLNELTVSDLNTMIRSIVYDPERLLPTRPPVQTRLERKSLPLPPPDFSRFF